MTTMRIVTVCSPDRQGLLPSRIKELQKAGFIVKFNSIKQDPKWPFTNGSIAERRKAFESAFSESDNDYVVATRGGYGAADLLSSLDWEDLAKSRATLVGYSDVCAFHSAFYAKFGRIGIHAPMPSSTLWKKNKEIRDINLLLQLLKKEKTESKIKLTAVTGDAQLKISGPLFGGNLATLSNLIGTEYFPKNLQNHILFFEDVSENGGRLSRYLNQWILSGALDGVKAIVWGALTDVGLGFKDCDMRLYRELSSRVKNIPCFMTKNIGHVTPNFPVAIGGPATIEARFLTSHFL